MYLGYQKNQEGQEFIAAVAKTKKELENMPCIKFTKIEKSEEDYVMYEGAYITVTEYEAIEEEKRKKEEKDALYAELDKLDLKAIRALRAIQAGTSTEQDTTKLADLEAEAEKVRQELKELGE